MPADTGDTPSEEEIPAWLTELGEEAIQVPSGGDLPGESIPSAENFPEQLPVADDIEQQIEAKAESYKAETDSIEPAPAWLLQLEEEASRAQAEAKPFEKEAAPAEALPEWLQGADEIEQPGEAEEESDEAEISFTEDAPAWLFDLRSKTRQVEAEVVISEESTPPPPGELPEWLQDAGGVEPGGEVEAEVGDSETEPRGAGTRPGEELSKWSRGFEDVKPGIGEAEAVGLDATPASELPEWLQDSGGEKAGIETEAGPVEELPTWLRQAASVEPIDESGKGTGEGEAQAGEELPALQQGGDDSEPRIEVGIEAGGTGALPDERTTTKRREEELSRLADIRQALVDRERSLPKEDKKSRVVKRVTGWLTGSAETEEKLSEEVVEEKTAEPGVEVFDENEAQESPTVALDITDELLADRLDQGEHILLEEDEVVPDLETSPYDLIAAEAVEISEEWDWQQESAIDGELETEQADVDLAGIVTEIEGRAEEVKAGTIQLAQAPAEETRRKPLLSWLFFWRRENPQEPVLSDRDIETRLQLGPREELVLPEEAVKEDEIPAYLPGLAEDDFVETALFVDESQVIEIQDQEGVDEGGAEGYYEEFTALELYDEEPATLEVYEEGDRIQQEAEAAQRFLQGDVTTESSEQQLSPLVLNEQADTGYQDIRGVALEGYVEPSLLPPGERPLSLSERIQVWINGLSPAQKTLLVGLVLLDIAIILSGAIVVAYSLFSLYSQSVIFPTATPPMNLPYPVGIKLPGGWPFELEKGVVEDGIWAPQEAEWLQGTEVRRWVALPWSKQLEAVFRSLEPGDRIEVVMSNADRLVYEVQSFQKVTVNQLEELNTNTPSLLLILANQDTDTRWVIIAVLAE
ncbi:MAG: hypothetical protein JXA78_16240 [Anaerolineales bacterium]|nr:hypothetical protein [Anaerolineales bacterium]